MSAFFLKKRAYTYARTLLAQVNFFRFSMTPPFLPSTNVLYEWSLGAYPATDVRENFVTTELWQIFILSYSPPPIVMGRGAEIIYDQVTFTFSKE